MVRIVTVLVVGAALVMMTGEYIYMNFPERLDISRVGAQVIIGVGFFFGGGRTIIVIGKNQIRGLATAVGLWACACIGLTVGIGLVEGAVIALVLVLFTLRLLIRLDEFIRYHAKIFDLYPEFETSRGAAQFMEEIRNRA